MRAASSAACASCGGAGGGGGPNANELSPSKLPNGVAFAIGGVRYRRFTESVEQRAKPDPIGWRLFVTADAEYPPVLNAVVIRAGGVVDMVPVEAVHGGLIKTVCACAEPA